MNTQGWMSDMEPARGMEGLPLLPSLSVMVEELPQSLVEVIEWFHQNNSNVWIVGGAIRNALLGTKILEFDLATTMTPDEMKAYPDTIPTGERYGTCLLYTSPSPRDLSTSRMPSSA